MINETQSNNFLTKSDMKWHIFLYFIKNLYAHRLSVKKQHICLLVGAYCFLHQFSSFTEQYCRLYLKA